LSGARAVVVGWPVVERTKSKHLVLILARELAANVATAMLIVDPDRTLVYFNEPAELLLGDTFASTGEMSVRDWGAKYEPQRLDGGPYALDEFPVTIALRAQRPAHDTVRFTAGDGVKRTVTVASYPLLSRSNEFAGVVTLFWEHRGDAK
jgi:PAS domain-containing protein